MSRRASPDSVGSRPSASIIFTRVTAEPTWPNAGATAGSLPVTGGRSNSEESLVPEHATEPAVALPISGVTGSSSRCGRRAWRMSSRVAPAPTVIDAGGSTTQERNASIRTWVPPSAAKQALTECSSPAARTGRWVAVLTTSCSSATDFGCTTTCGLLSAERFQLVTSVGMRVILRRSYSPRSARAACT